MPASLTDAGLASLVLTRTTGAACSPAIQLGARQMADMALGGCLVLLIVGEAALSSLAAVLVCILVVLERAMAAAPRIASEAVQNDDRPRRCDEAAEVTTFEAGPCRGQLTQAGGSLVMDEMDAGGSGRNAPPPAGEEADASPDLDATSRRLSARALSANTLRAYSGALRRLRKWLAGRVLDDHALADYLAHLFNAGRSPATAKQVMAAVRWCTRQTSVECPIGPEARNRLAGFVRAGAERGRGQAAAISWADADAMCEYAEAAGGLRGLRAAALTAAMSWAMLRISEASALDISDLKFSDGGAVQLTVRRSKTDQEARGRTLHVGQEGARRLRRWIDAADIDSGPLFRPLGRGGRVGTARLGADSVRRAVVGLAAEAGIEGRVSGHSLRVGAAQSLMEAGATLPDLMASGRWSSSSMVAHYTQSQAAERSAMARLRG